MDVGLAVSVAVTCLGGGVGGTGGVFFLQPLTNSSSANIPRIRIQLFLFTSCPPRQLRFFRSLFHIKKKTTLSIAPVRLRVAAFPCELLQVRAVAMHAPNLFRTAAI